jgi:Na+-driven multidrug efflux pump
MKPEASTLTTGSIPRTLFVFTLPMLMGNVLQSINGSVNSFWVGNYLGEAALSATSNANAVMFLLLGAVFGITMAATILIAQHVGARRCR